jgi:hypothetical protein
MRLFADYFSRRWAAICPIFRSICNVTTWHNDNGRTGQNSDETTLTTSNVNQATFGKICSYALLANEQIYAQPLALGNIIF